MSIDKLLSGRFWLTIMAGVVFVYTACTGMLMAETVAVILYAVFKEYFGRADRKDNETKPTT